MRINQLQCAQYGLGIGKQHGIFTPVPKRVLQGTVADVTMPLLQEQQCILGELLLNTSQPSVSPTPRAAAASSEKPVTLGSAPMEKSAVPRM